MEKLTCASMAGYDCTNTDITHIDSSGFVYCSRHGEIRKRYKRCRKLKPTEIKRLESGQTLTRYEVNK